MKIKREDRIHEEHLIVQRSIHGPVIAQKDNTAIALRVLGLNQPQGFQQWWDMARATNFTQFETALKRLQIPMFTVMYSDRARKLQPIWSHARLSNSCCGAVILQL